MCYSVECVVVDQLTFTGVRYCAKLDGLSDAGAEAIVEKYANEYGVILHAPSDPDFPPPCNYYCTHPDFGMRSWQSMSERLLVECGKALQRFEKQKKLYAHAYDEYNVQDHWELEFLWEVEGIVNVVNLPQSGNSNTKPPTHQPGAEGESLLSVFKGLTPDKGKWVPVGEFARLNGTTIKTLENRRTVLGGKRKRDKTKGIDSEGRPWKKDWMLLKNGAKSTRKKVCWYWVTHEEFAN